MTDIEEKITFRLPGDLKQEFQKKLATDEMPMSIFFRKVIREYLRSRFDPYVNT
jgi:hypothetical protein